MSFRHTQYSTNIVGIETACYSNTMLYSIPFFFLALIISSALNLKQISNHSHLPLFNTPLSALQQNTETPPETLPESPSESLPESLSESPSESPEASAMAPPIQARTNAEAIPLLDGYHSDGGGHYIETVLLCVITTWFHL